METKMIRATIEIFESHKVKKDSPFEVLITTNVSVDKIRVVIPDLPTLLEEVQIAVNSYTPSAEAINVEGTVEVHEGKESLTYSYRKNI